MRIQFLVQAYSHPSHLNRLCARLSEAGPCNIAVQWDATRPLPDLDDHAVCLMPTVKRVRWGRASQLEALLRSLALLRDDRFDWLVMLSGQDYPIRPMAELIEFFEATSEHLFMDVESEVPTPRARDAPEVLQLRYFYRHFWMPASAWDRLPKDARRMVEGYCRVTLSRSPFAPAVVLEPSLDLSPPSLAFRSRQTPFDRAFPCRKGSDWFAMSRDVFEYLLDHERRDAFLRYYKRVSIPTESYFASLLWPRWGDACPGHNLHFVRWEGHCHPETLGAADLDEMRASRRFFARKFDPDDSELLKLLDAELLEK